VPVLALDLTVADELGRVTLFEGEHVTFEIGKSLRGTPKAMRVEPVNREPIDVNLDDHREDVVIRFFRNKTGFATRALGGDVFIHTSELNVDPAFLQAATQDLKPGTKLNTGIKPPVDGTKYWAARDFYIID
jgi:cold shock CspA family protein